MIEVMWSMQKNVIAGILVVLTLLSSADACSRIPSGETNEVAEVEKAKFVFRGLVTKVEIVSDVFLIDNIMVTKVYYKPIEVLKGEVPEDGYILSQTGYFGGCAIPVLVGLEYLFAPQKHGLILNLEDRSELKLLVEESIGMVSIFNATQLPAFKPRLDEAMAEVREWAAGRR